MTSSDRDSTTSVVKMLQPAAVLKLEERKGLTEETQITSKRNQLGIGIELQSKIMKNLWRGSRDRITDSYSGRQDLHYNVDNGEKESKHQGPGKWCLCL